MAQPRVDAQLPTNAAGAGPAADVVERIYAEHFARVLALGRLLTGDATAGEDVAQEVFERVVVATTRDEHYLKEPVWPLLRTILVRCVLQRRRRLLREAARLARLDRRPATGDWCAETLDLIRAVRRLPMRMRITVGLFYWQDMSTAQVAEVMGCSTKTVENHLREARRRLAAWLRDVGEKV